MTDWAILWRTLVIGAGATLFMDLWALFLKRAFGIPSANYCLVGRWIRHMPEGRFAHASIAAAAQKPLECAVGWIVHYVVGIAFGVLLVSLATERWLARPEILPALQVGVGTVILPLAILHPAFGLGFAASKAPNPAQARLRSVMAHAAFGVGLYLSAVAANMLAAGRA